MFTHKFEQDKNTGNLSVRTHLGEKINLKLLKEAHHSFRVSYTAISDIIQIPAQVTSVWKTHVTVSCPKYPNQEIRARFLTRPKINQIVYLIEYYSTDMEELGRPSWIISPEHVEEPQTLFINVDELDTTGSLCRRTRIDLYLGYFKVFKYGN